MRCGRAERLMAAGIDGALTPADRAALDAHVVVCEACAREMRVTGTLLSALDGLGREAAVPARLEQATLRRIRLAADEPVARTRPRSVWAWLAMPVPALALAATVVVALSFTALRRAGEVPAPKAAAPAARVAKAPLAAPPPRAVASAKRTAPVAPAPAEPPAELAAAPDLFVDMPILRHMEKLSHYEAIETTTLDDGDTGTGTRDGDSG